MIRRYGASPVHLLAHALCLALAAWAILQVVDIRRADNVAAWFVAALVLHDLVVLPAYSALDRVAERARLHGVALVNHLRAPVILSALTFLVFFPLILGRSDGNLRRVSGIEPHGYLERWLALVIAFFALSAIVLAVRIHRLDGTPPASVAAEDEDAPA